LEISQYLFKLRKKSFNIFSFKQISSTTYKTGQSLLTDPNNCKEFRTDLILLRVIINQNALLKPS